MDYVGRTKDFPYSVGADAVCLVGGPMFHVAGCFSHRVEAFAMASAKSSVELVRSRAASTVVEKYWFIVVAPVIRLIE